MTDESTTTDIIVRSVPNKDWSTRISLPSLAIITVDNEHLCECGSAKVSIRAVRSVYGSDDIECIFCCHRTLREYMEQRIDFFMGRLSKAPDLDEMLKGHTRRGDPLSVTIKFFRNHPFHTLSQIYTTSLLQARNK